jgi:hypothetical protein
LYGVPGGSSGGYRRCILSHLVEGRYADAHTVRDAVMSALDAIPAAPWLTLSRKTVTDRAMLLDAAPGATLVEVEAALAHLDLYTAACLALLTLPVFEVEATLGTATTSKRSTESLAHELLASRATDEPMDLPALLAGLPDEADPVLMKLRQWTSREYDTVRWR